MRKEKALTTLLRDFVAIVAEEASHSPKFAARLDDLLSPLPDRKPAKQRTPRTEPVSAPDLHTELKTRGDDEFRYWLREQPLPVLRASIRAHDLDPTRKTARWKEAEKVADFIADAMRARLARGSAFMGRGSGE
jgi:hypothetical protein